MIKSIIVCIPFIALIFSSCDSRQNRKEAVQYVESKPYANDADKSIEIQSERKIIKEGQISFETDNIQTTTSFITKIIQESEGYIAKDDVFNYENRTEHRIEARLPADKFDTLLVRIEGSVEKLDNKNISALDVTEEYIDVKARVETKKELESRYKELLKQATKVEEILAIEKELGQIRTDIESVEGRLQYLKDKISYSTLTITCYQKTNAVFGFSSKFGSALKGGWNNLLWFIIGLTNLWPFVLIFILMLYVTIRLRKRRIRKNAA